MRRSAKVAVIGAGAAGLAAVREAVREGHSVTCYEVRVTFPAWRSWTV